MHILTKIVQMANMWNEFLWKFGNTSVHNYQNGLSDLWATFSVGFKKKEKKKDFHIASGSLARKFNKKGENTRLTPIDQLNPLF